jgi:hypothetical protein
MWIKRTTPDRATDPALIIDAMDLLRSTSVDGFCLVSSDSDFTRLATRMREAGLIVYGFGEKKTPEAFRAACNKFVFIEILTQQPTAVEKRRRRHACVCETEAAVEVKFSVLRRRASLSSTQRGHSMHSRLPR